MIDLTCCVCSTQFRSRNRTHRFCSKRCRMDSRNEVKRAKERAETRFQLERRTCVVCGQGFTQTHWRQTYCSYACSRRSHRPPKSIRCAVCDREFEKRFGASLTCSLECSTVWRARWRTSRPAGQCHTCDRKIEPDRHGNRKYCSVPCRQHAQRLRTYGLGVDDFNALVVAQDDQCAICGSTDPLYIDHCHGTNQVRGLICRQCNLLLGHARDNVDTLRRAIEYLT